ncbi:MAG: flagellar basal body rod protein FlgB [Phycisphaerales bacterium]
MLIRDVMNSGARPALAETMHFAAERHRQIVHNIANLDTPNFQPKDLSVKDFRSALRAAVVARRAEASGSDTGAFTPPRTKEWNHRGDGTIEVEPRTPSQNILYHDRNNRDLERLMQDLSENGLQFRFAADVMRQQGELLRAAISQRS